MATVACGARSGSGAGPGTAGPGLSEPGGTAGASPSAGVSPALGPLACSVVTGTLPGTGTPVLRAVSATALAGYDVVTFTFAPVGQGPPPGGSASYRVSGAQPPFVQDAGGAPIAVTGTAFVQVQFHDAYGYDPIDPTPQATYAGPTDLHPGLGTVAEVRETGDFEGSLTWIVGMAKPACWRVVPGRDRLEVDVPT